MINLDDTRTLLGVVERSFKPTTTLVDTFSRKCAPLLQKPLKWNTVKARAKWRRL